MERALGMRLAPEVTATRSSKERSVLRSWAGTSKSYNSTNENFPNEVLGVARIRLESARLVVEECASERRENAGLGSPQDLDAGPSGGAAESAPPNLPVWAAHCGPHRSGRRSPAGRDIAWIKPTVVTSRPLELMSVRKVSCRILPDDKPIRLSNRLRLDLPDADLVSELLNNRPEAHRLVVQRFTPLVRALLRRSLGPKDDIDDAQQEVFWSLFRSIDTLRDPCSLRAFIMTITFRAVLHERRRRRPSIPLDCLPARMGLEAKRDEAEASYALLRLGSLLMRLSERERKTFVMRFVEGMTVSEISEALAVSEATTRRSYTRAWSFVSKWAAQDPFLFDYFSDASQSAA